MRAAAAHRAMVDADHAIAPDIGDGFARYANIGRRVVGGAPGSSPTERATTVRHPSRQARKFDPHVAAVTASFDRHDDVYTPNQTSAKGGFYRGRPSRSGPDFGSMAVPKSSTRLPLFDCTKLPGRSTYPRRTSITILWRSADALCGLPVPNGGFGSYSMANSTAPPTSAPAM